MQQLLRKVGHSAVYFTDREGVTRWLREVTPDLVVLDVRLPDVDGMDVVRKIRHEPSLRELPVVIFSGVSYLEVQAETLQSAAPEFIVKGLDWQMLLNRIEGLLPHSHT